MTNENDSLNTLIKAIPMGDYVGDVLAAGINLRHAITPPPQASQPVTASMEALLRKLLEIARDGLATVSEMGRENADPIVKLLTDKADETNAKLWENGLGQLQATPAATEGERCDAEYTQKLLCEYPENHTGYHSWWELLKRQQPTETEVTG